MKLGKVINNISELKQDSNKTSIDFMRKPYYSFSDGVSSIEGAARKLKEDRELINLIESLKNIQHDIVMHLNKKYNWD